MMKKTTDKVDSRKKSKRYSINKVKKRAPRQSLQEKRLSKGHLYVAAPEFSGSLFDEMKLNGSKNCMELTPGVLIESEEKFSDYIFARQVLPNAEVVYGLHINDLAQHFFKAISEEQHTEFLASPHSAEVFAPFAMRAPRGQKQKNPLAADVKEFASIVEKKRIGRAEKFEIETAKKAKYRVQVILLSTTELWYSFSENSVLDTADSKESVHSLNLWPSPFEGGKPLLPDFPKAPSSAYRKFAEALCLSGDFPTIKDTVLDLGGVPGGWSYVALEHGAQVISVDRGEMDPALMLHAKLTHLKKDAFTQTPFEQGTYVICDIIDLPERILGLLEQAKEHTQIRAMVFTIKLKRPVDISLLKKIQKNQDKDDRFTYRMKHLVHNKAEVTLILKRL